MINNLADLDPFHKEDFTKKKFKLWDNKLSLGFELPYSSFVALFDDWDPDACLNKCHCCGKRLIEHPWIRGPHDTLCDECAKYLEDKYDSKSFPWVFKKEDDTARLLEYFYTYL